MSEMGYLIVGIIVGVLIGILIVIAFIFLYGIKSGLLEKKNERSKTDG